MMTIPREAQRSAGSSSSDRHSPGCGTGGWFAARHRRTLVRCGAGVRAEVRAGLGPAVGASVQ